MSYLRTIIEPLSIITPIEHGATFPEKLYILHKRYHEDIALFRKLILESSSSAELLSRIRDTGLPADRRMSLLKLFRRCVSLVLDTETSKKIRKHKTEKLVENYEQTFKPIKALKEDFRDLPTEEEYALAALIGEYDDRGQQGYLLTELFFAWFEENFPELIIDGPIGAGPDIELSSLFPEFTGSFPCDFVIKDNNGDVLAVGFARYDSTRGGAQSDDRTSGNRAKVQSAKQFCDQTGEFFRLIFLAEGPGLAHPDTWEEACKLDDSWDGNVRVVTLAIAEDRITNRWLEHRRPAG